VSRKDPTGGEEAMGVGGSGPRAALVAMVNAASFVSVPTKGRRTPASDPTLGLRFGVEGLGLRVGGSGLRVEG